MEKNNFKILAVSLLVVLLAGIMAFLVSKNMRNNFKDGTSDDGNSDTEKKYDDKYDALYDLPEGGNPENVGKIVFASNDGKTTQADYDLYVMKPDGSDKRKLTDVGKFINHPVWSPEYSRIAYAALADGNVDKIFIMTADGSISRQLTSGDSRDKFPTWSPDGKKLAYISYRNNVPNLFVMDVYGGNIKQLTFVEGASTVLWPSWSPVDNDLIAFSYNKAGNDIDFRLHTIKSDGTDEWEILSSNDKDLSDHEPAWSPDGKKIYFLSNRTRHMEIWKLDYDKWQRVMSEKGITRNEDIGLKRVSNLYSANVNPDHRPRVSPDGKKIVFYGVGSDWQNIGTNLYTLDVDGANLTNITKSIDGNEWPDW
jgi:Tol biopolymer transport system component